MDKKIMLPLGAVVVLAVLTLGYFALRNGGDRQEAAVEQAVPTLVHIGVAQPASEPLYEEIKQGIIEEFRRAGYEEGVDIAFDFQNAQGDEAMNQTIAHRFASGDYALVMPLGTLLSQAVAGAVKNRPVVFGAVADPVRAGLLATSTATSTNVTGTSDAALFREHLMLLKQFMPKTTTIGIVYNSKEEAVVAELAQVKAVSEDLGLKIVTATAESSDKVSSAARSIVKKVQAFYMLRDSTILAGQEALIKVTIDNKKLFVSTDQSGVEKGALATYGTNYRALGERTAEIAVRVLRGESSGVIPVVGVTDAELFINTDTAKAIGLEISPELLDQAKMLFPQAASNVATEEGKTSTTSTGSQ